MEHMQFLMERSDSGEDPCGHALMASCPPNINVGVQPVPEIPYGHGLQAMPAGAPENQKTWDLKKGDLALLLDLSSRLNLEGEITPVMAWGMVLSHPAVEQLGVKEIERVRGELECKIRCYGRVTSISRGEEWTAANKTQIRCRSRRVRSEGCLGTEIS